MTLCNQRQMSNTLSKKSSLIEVAERQHFFPADASASTLLKSNGFKLDTSAGKFGKLINSAPDLLDAPVLRARMAQDGYLFFRNLLDRSVLDTLREHIAKELEQSGVLDVAPRHAVDHLPAKSGVNLYGVVPGLDGPTVKTVSQQQPLLDLFGRLFGEQARALDYSWPRVAGPGRSEWTHADWVYMCRGTPRMFTTWIPLMDVPLLKGPLMILERSHLDNKHMRKYLTMDADALGPLEGLRLKHGKLTRSGRFSARPDRVCTDFGTRWLSENFKIGDVVVFSTRGLHATLDNQTDAFRASIDVRFQPASDQSDPRFVGSNPPAHSQRPISLFDRASYLRRRISNAVWPQRGYMAFRKPTQPPR
jgi:hypothetical protein